MAASRTGAAERRAPRSSWAGAMGTGDRMRPTAVSAALRRSRRVGMVKLVLATSAIALSALVIVWPQLREEGIRFSLGLSSVDIGGNLRPSMDNARFIGTDRHGRPFMITADSAEQEKDSDIVALRSPKADITEKDGSWLALTADSGAYNRGDGTLKLVGSVNLFHDDGYEFRTETARLDLDAGLAEGDDPVVGQGPLGIIESEGFRIADKGRTIIFTGAAKLILHGDGV